MKYEYVFHFTLIFQFFFLFFCNTEQLIWITQFICQPKLYPMKTLTHFISGVVLIMALLSSGACSKSNSSNAKSDENLKSSPATVPTTIKISCQGEGCSDGDACKAKFGSDLNSFSCCEGCHLVIEYVIDGEIKPVKDATRLELNNFNFYYEEASEFISGSYSELFEITSVDIVYTEKNYFVLYHFSCDLDNDGSILIYSPIGRDKPITVDCTGSCNGSCVEKAIIMSDGTIDVSCGSDADGCKMIID